MTRRLAIACCVLLFATSALAQSRGAKPKTDLLSGTWTGELIQESGSNRMAVTLELKFDGKSAVSGTIIGFSNPGDVKAGTFDPKTGALKLQLGKTGEAAVLIVLEGTVAKGTATGRLTGETAGEFKLVKKG